MINAQMEQLDHEYDINLEHISYLKNDIEKELKKQYESTYARYNIIGTVLCIVAIVPLFIVGAMTENDFYYSISLGVMFVIIGIATQFYIIAGIRWATYQKLLQEKDYSKEVKQKNKATSGISTAYWLIVTASYLGISFSNDNWRDSWIIWPVAGVLYGAIIAIFQSLSNHKK